MNCLNNSLIESRAKVSMKTLTKVGSKVGIQKIDVRKPLLLVGVFRGTLSSLLSPKLIGGEFQHRLQQGWDLGAIFNY